MDKIIRIGKGENGNVFCKIEYADGKLSITGVEGPKRNGDCVGSCGQIIIDEWDIKEYAAGWNESMVSKFRDTWKNWHLNNMRPGCEHQVGPEWTPADVSIYHYNLTFEALKAKNEAKAAAIAALDRGDTFTPSLDQSMMASLTYSISSDLPEPPEFYEPAKQTAYSRPVEVKKTNWLKQSEHPRGYLSKPCQVCGYKYGSKWLFEPVPADIVEFLESLPETDIVPAWV